MCVCVWECCLCEVGWPGVAAAGVHGQPCSPGPALSLLPPHPHPPRLPPAAALHRARGGGRGHARRLCRAQSAGGRRRHCGRARRRQAHRQGRAVGDGAGPAGAHQVAAAPARQVARPGRRGAAVPQAVRGPRGCGGGVVGRGRGRWPGPPALLSLPRGPCLPLRAPSLPPLSSLLPPASSLPSSLSPSLLPPCPPL